MFGDLLVFLVVGWVVLFVRLSVGKGSWEGSVR